MEKIKHFNVTVATSLLTKQCKFCNKKSEKGGHMHKKCGTNRDLSSGKLCGPDNYDT